MIAALAAAAWAGPPSCAADLPIAGTAGLLNAQAARDTQANVYSAAAFFERESIARGIGAARDDHPLDGWGFFSLQFDWHLGAARVPTRCGDPEPTDAPDDFGFNPHHRWERKHRVYDEPLDLYATNYAIGLGVRSAGVFYAASATQSVLGQRLFAIPAQGFNAAAMFVAPVLGDALNQSGTTSYSLEWIGGLYLESPWIGARVGYQGSRGLFATFDERTVGGFATVSLVQGEKSTPWDYLRLGVEALSPRRFGADAVADAVGATSVFLRDLEFAGGVGQSDSLRETGGDRLRTFHLQQRSIGRWVDVEGAADLGRGTLYEAHVGAHTTGFHPERGAKDRVPGGALLRVGVVNVPAAWAMGVEGGPRLSIRAQGSMFSRQTPTRTEVTVLFNDPEQLALFPFAANALEVRAAIRFVPQD